jgi:5'-nucleotidase
MNKKPKILITNDDGILAKGIKTLYESLCDIADVTIVAPMTDKSGKALSLTLRKPLHVDSFPWPNNVPAWSVSGTTTDSVKMALAALMTEPPDLVISGINRGSNAGKNVLYSGTLAGAIEASFHDIPGIAFSCESFEDPNYDLAKEYIPGIVSHFIQNPAPSNCVLNVTFPKNVTDEPTGIKIAKQGKGYWIEDISKRTHPLGDDYYWLSGKMADFEEEEDSDIALLKEGYITIVPLQVSDLTHYPQFSKLSKECNQEFKKKMLLNT